MSTTSIKLIDMIPIRSNKHTLLCMQPSYICRIENHPLIGLILHIWVRFNAVRASINYDEIWWVISLLHFNIYISAYVYWKFCNNNDNIVYIYKTMKTHYWIGNKAYMCIYGANDLLFEATKAVVCSWIRN